jgi:hypothetical protein
MRFQKYECRKVAYAKPCFTIRRDIQSGSKVRNALKNFAQAATQP